MIKLNIVISVMSFIFSLRSGPLPPTAMSNFLLLTMFRKARYRLETENDMCCSKLCSKMSSVSRWRIHLKTPCGSRASLSLCTVSRSSNSAFRFAIYVAHKRDWHLPWWLGNVAPSLYFIVAITFFICNTYRSLDFSSQRSSLTCS